MREIFGKLPAIDLTDERAYNYVLLDTCFFIHTFENQKEHKLRALMEKKQLAMTSFNVEEFLLKEHVVDERVRENTRRFLKKYPEITVIHINVMPGQREQEKNFVRTVDPELLKEIPDASDCIIMAAAIKTCSSIMTKDKHHLFTTKLENYLTKYNLKVYKEFHDIMAEI